MSEDIERHKVIRSKSRRHSIIRALTKPFRSVKSADSHDSLDSLEILSFCPLSSSPQEREIRRNDGTSSRNPNYNAYFKENFGEAGRKSSGSHDLLADGCNTLNSGPFSVGDRGSSVRDRSSSELPQIQEFQERYSKSDQGHLEFRSSPKTPSVFRRTRLASAQSVPSYVTLDRKSKIIRPQTQHYGENRSIGFEDGTHFATPLRQCRTLSRGASNEQNQDCVSQDAALKSIPRKVSKQRSVDSTPSDESQGVLCVV